MFVSFLLITGYIVICPLIVKRITDEKVAKAKEMLRMMGMSDWVFWGSHFINFFAVMFVQSIIITLLIVYGFGNGTAIHWSNGLIFFISLILYNISSILSSMLLTTVFNRPVIAVVVSVVLFEISYVVPLSLLDPMTKSSTSDYHPKASLLALTSLLPNSGFHWLIAIMGTKEGFGEGLTWSNLWDTNTPFKEFTAGYALLMQFISIFFYGELHYFNHDDPYLYYNNFPRNSTYS